LFEFKKYHENITLLSHFDKLSAGSFGKHTAGSFEAQCGNFYNILRLNQGPPTGRLVCLIKVPILQRTIAAYFLLARGSKNK